MSAVNAVNAISHGPAATGVRACLPWTLALFAAACAAMVAAGVPGLYRSPDGGFVSLGVSDRRRTSMMAPPVLVALAAAAAAVIPLAYHMRIGSHGAR